MTVRIGINGLGRIGRNLFRAARDRRAIAEVVAVNDLADADRPASLLRHDSVLGHFPGGVRVTWDLVEHIGRGW